MKLAVGTSQLGMPYGIANTAGQPDAAEALAIVKTAWNHGVRFFDSAQAYGISQAVLGRCFRELGIGDEVRVISKLNPATPIDSSDKILQGVEETLIELGVPFLWAFLLHRERLLEEWDDTLGSTLRKLREEGVIARLGVSLYEPRAAQRALEIPDMEVLQVPASVFDRRMQRSGIFERAALLDRQIFVRSVYLQGLALMEPTDLPRELSFAREACGSYGGYCRENNLDPREFALGYVSKMAPDAWLVVGVETQRQCEENCRLARRAGGIDPAGWDSRWPNDDLRLVNPSQWFEQSP